MYWAGLLIHSAAILAAANILGRIPRKLAPSYRHRLLLAGFGLLLIWPLLSAAVPPIYLPLWHREHLEGSVTVQQNILRFQPPTVPSHVINWPFTIWIIGVFLTVARIIAGHLSVFRITQRAIPMNDTASQQLLADLCRRLGFQKAPVLLTVAGPVMPFTFGLRQPRILLPCEYKEWSPLRQRTVLLHEVAHARRRDVRAQFFANVVTAIWWFQPLCWINGRSLRHESEQACDALVLASGVRPSDYATELFEIAHNFSKGQRPFSAAITIARRGELESRMRAILYPQPRYGAQKRSFAAVAALILWAVAASAITLTPQQMTSPGGTSMKRTFLSGLLSSVGLSAATIGGSLFDPSGAAVSQAKASLYNPETAATTETTTTPDGKFVFNNLPAGSYILRVDKPGFASQFREFNVQADSKLERKLTLNIRDYQEEIAVSSQPANQITDRQSSGQGPVRIGGEVAEANSIKKVQPIYPASAKAAGVQGTVNLETVISKDGMPLEITVASSPSDDLTQSALEAVRQWRYRPTLLNGEPVEVVARVIVNYTLSQ